MRGIRRKNLGEALLWSELLRDEIVVGITLEPINPAEAKSYERWNSLARELNSPIRSGVVDAGRIRFFEALAAADFILTTSVAEGFGMVFLKSWLAQREYGHAYLEIKRLLGQDAAHLNKTELREMLQDCMRHLTQEEIAFNDLILSSEADQGQ